MSGISAVVITFNEEKNLPKCLNSLQTVADEIIVVDSFSTDSTIDICKKFNVKLFQKKWEGYSSAKNYGNNLTSFDYILSLDADEELSKELQKSILKIKENISFDAYSMNRITNYCGKWIKHCGWYPDKKIRLWNKNKGHWEGIIHEKVVFNSKVKIAHLKGDILHYSYYSISQHIKQSNIFTDIAAKEMFEKNEKTSYFKIIFSTLFKFFYLYFLKLGFLDGFYGLVICVISSYANFIKYSKLKLMCLETKQK